MRNPLDYPQRAIESELHDGNRRCSCENEHCQVPHRIGGCSNPGSVRALFGGKLCPACAEYMPADYMEDD